MAPGETFKSLSGCDEVVLDRFFHAVIDGICGQRQSSVRDFGSTWTVQQYKDLVAASERVFRECVRTGSRDVSAISEPSARSVAARCLEARELDLKSALVLASCAIGNDAQLINFDWNVRMTLASDTLATQRVPLFQLDLEVAQPDGSLRHIPVEMSQEELKQLITKLNAANETVRELR
eukprot:UC1_evm2s1006